LKLVGSWWLPDGETHLVEWFSKHDPEYQKAHRKEALRHVTNWHTAVDIGAHVGTWSRGLAEKFKEVWAFEPVPEHVECFRRNVPRENVSLVRCALGEREGSTGLSVGVENSGHSVIDQYSERRAPLQTLDYYCLEHVGYIKADCEGYEVFALKGGEETILRCKPIISVEQKPSNFGPRYAARDYLLSLGMKELGRVHDDIVLGW
jgi:FkbM family methyltransferase